MDFFDQGRSIKKGEGVRSVRAQWAGGGHKNQTRGAGGPGDADGTQVRDSSVFRGKAARRNRRGEKTPKNRETKTGSKEYIF